MFIPNHSSLLVPLILWNAPPTHNCTAISIIENTNIDGQIHIITGGVDGHLCQWVTDENYKEVQPTQMLIGHTSSICGIDSGSNEWAEQVIITCSIDGKLCVWKLNDGTCVSYSSIIGNSISPLTDMRTLCNDRYVVLIGSLNQTILVDIWKNTKLNMNSNYLDSPLCFSVVGENRQVSSSLNWDSVLIAGGKSGLVNFVTWTKPRGGSIVSHWKLSRSWRIIFVGESNIEVIEDDRSEDVTRIRSYSHPESSTSCPISIVIYQDLSLLLIIFKKIWIVLPTAFLIEVINQNSFPQNQIHFGWTEEREHWLNGAFNGKNGIIMWTENGKIISFSLDSTSESLSDELDLNFRFRQRPQGAELNRIIDESLFSFHDCSTLRSDLGSPCKCGCTYDNSFFQPEFRVAFRETATRSSFLANICRKSTLRLWLISESSVTITYDFISNSINRMWNSHKNKTVFHDIDVSNEKSVTCTVLIITRSCFPSISGDTHFDKDEAKRDSETVEDEKESIFLESIPLLVLGNSDGSIRVREFISKINRGGQQNSKEQFFEFTSSFPCHSGSKITSLQYCVMEGRHGRETKGIYEGFADRIPSSSLNINSATSTMSLLFERVQDGLRHAIYSHSTVKHESSRFSTEGSNASYDLGRLKEESLHYILCSGDASGRVGIWWMTLKTHDLSDNWMLSVSLVSSFHLHIDRITMISFSPRSIESSKRQLIACAGEDGNISVLFVAEARGKSTQSWENRREPTKTSEKIKSDSDTRVSKFYAQCLFELQGHGAAIVGLEWRMNLDALLVTCTDKMVYVWSLTTGVLERCIPSAMVYMEHAIPYIYRPSYITLPRDASVSINSVPNYPESNDISNILPINVILFSLNNIGQAMQEIWSQLQSKQNDILSMKNQGGEIEEFNEHFDEKVNFCSSSPPIELTLLSFLLSWGIDDTVDALCQKSLHLNESNLIHSIGLRGEGNTVVAPFPWTVYKEGRWQHSSTLTALIQLSIVSLSMLLMAEDRLPFGIDADKAIDSLAEEYQMLWSRIITHHSIVIPETMIKDGSLFYEPSFECLAVHGFNDGKSVQLAARLLLQGVVQRLTPAVRSATCAEWAAKLHCTSSNMDIQDLDKSTQARRIAESVGPMLLVLSIIGISSPGDISPATARQVCNLLVILLYGESSHACLSSELLAKGIALWRPHFIDLPAMVQRLIYLSMISSDNSSGEISTSASVGFTTLSTIVMRFLIELGICDTEAFLSIARQDVSKVEYSDEYRCAVIRTVSTLIITHSIVLYRQLPAIVETILASLDPTRPEKRRGCLSTSTRALHDIMKRFPMVGFHKETQRYAVGTIEGIIIIYDLRTATKWRLLEGHASSISCVSFSTDGETLVSYSASENCIRLWRSGSRGIFGGMLGMQDRCIQQIQLPELEKNKHDLTLVIRNCVLRWISQKQIQLIREDASSIVINIM